MIFETSALLSANHRLEDANVELKLTINVREKGPFKVLAEGENRIARLFLVLHNSGVDHDLLVMHRHNLPCIRVVGVCLIVNIQDFHFWLLTGLSDEWRDNHWQNILKLLTESLCQIAPKRNERTTKKAILNWSLKGPLHVSLCSYFQGINPHHRCFPICARKTSMDYGYFLIITKYDCIIELQNLKSREIPCSLKVENLRIVRVEF